jgi:DNA-binding MarR family transcriptional regulator
MASPARPKALPLPASTSFLLVAAGRIAQGRLEEALAAHGLTLRHLGALGHLSSQPDLSYSDLARRAGVTPQSMHATVRQMEEVGAVARQHEGQGHRARLEVTARGRELLASAATVAHELDAELLASVPDAQRDALRALLLTIAMPPSLRGTIPLTR